MEISPWICPSCMEIQRSVKDDCKLCLVSSSSAQVAIRGSGAPVLKRAESIFFECVQYNLQYTVALPVYDSLQSDIDAFLESEEMKKLINSNWRIRVPLSNLLKSALKGEKLIDFDVSDKIDTNSASLYTILVDALNGRLRLMKEQAHDVNVPAVVRPSLFWSCPNCYQRYPTKTTSCKTCNIPKKAVVLCQKGSIGTLLNQVTDIVIACISHHVQAAPSHARDTASLSQSIDNLLSCNAFNTIVSSNWRIQDALTHLLYSALAGVPETISFESSSWMDVSSIAVYMILADRINARITTLFPTSGYRIERPVVEKYDSAFWICPSCNRQNSHEKKSCPLCYINKSVVSLCRQGIAAPALNDAEKLFLACVELNTSLTGSDREFRQSELQSSISAFLDCQPLSSLVASNWRVKDAIAHLLRTALTGDVREIPFASLSGMDVNSTGVYLVLTDRINACLARSYPESGYSVKRPEMVKFDAEHWNCPNCQRAILHECEACVVCNIHKKVYSVASGSLFMTVEALLMSCIEVHCGVWEGVTSKEERLVELKQEVERCLEGEPMKDLCGSHWRVQSALSHLLREAWRGEAHKITFQSQEWMDINSTVAYLILADRVNARLSDSEQCASFTVDRPEVTQHNRDFWTCPNCREGIPHEEDACKVCGIHNKVIHMEQNAQTGPVLKTAENLFMSCVELHCGMWTGDGTREDRLEVLRTAITALMEGEQISILSSSKWRVKDAISNLLHTALSGETRTVSFESAMWMDVNSTASYMLLTDRINTRLAESYPEAGYTVQRPEVFRFDVNSWQCPGCQAVLLVNEVGDSCRSCKISKKVLHYARSSQAGPIFKAAENLFMSCVELHCGMWTGNGTREDRLEVLRTAITALLEGEGLNTMVAGKWRVKEPISHLLTSVLEGRERVITFEASSSIDSNSKGLYMLLVDSINARLEKVASTSGYWVKRPVVSSSS